MFASKTYFIKKQQGVTLLELMISLFIAMMILFYITAIFLFYEKNHDMQVALTSVTENANMISQLFKNEIHAAGYIGCGKLTDTFPIKNNTPLKITLHGIDVASKILTISHADFQHAELIKNMHSDSVLYVTNTVKFSAGDVLLVSDCKSADIFMVKNIDFYSKEINKITAVTPLANRYEKNALVSQYEVNTYYIDTTDRFDTKGFPIHALYQKDIYQNKTELIEGIEDMKINADGGVAIECKLKSVTRFALEKEWFIYAGLH